MLYYVGRSMSQFITFMKTNKYYNVFHYDTVNANIKRKNIIMCVVFIFISLICFHVGILNLHILYFFKEISTFCPAAVFF